MQKLHGSILPSLAIMCYSAVDLMANMTDYLLGSDGTPQREYARQAAADGIITYSYSTDNFKWIEPDSSIRWPSSSITKNPKSVDEQQSKWIDTIFDFIDSITGVQFQKVENQRGEIHLNLVDDGEETYSPLSLLNGYAEWNGWHDKKQYGGIQDIRSIQTAIAGALGITRPNDESSESSYTWDDSIMAYRSGGMDSFGATFLYTQDDQTALKTILGTPPNTDPVTGEIIHKSEGRETLMIGTDGVKDVFQLTSKGMLLDRERDKNDWINHYNSSYIANLNPADGDKILIHRSLLDPKTPQFNQSKKLAKKYKKAKLSFMYEPGADTYKSKANVYYNGAGKILMNTNGKKPGLTPKNSPFKNGISYNSAGINGQIAAFVDPVGPETIPFQSSWLDFFM